MLDESVRRRMKQVVVERLKSCGRDADAASIAAEPLNPPTQAARKKKKKA